MAEVKTNFKEVFRRLNARVKSATAPEHMKQLAEEAGRMVRVRTRLGQGVNKSGAKGKLKALSEDYIDFRETYSDLSEFTTPPRSNLTLTGEMLESIEILDVKDGKVEIGPNLNTRRDGKATNQKVAEGVSKARPFMNFHKLEIKKLARFYEKNILGKIFRR
jgi:hypothetical protein